MSAPRSVTYENALDFAQRQVAATIEGPDLEIVAADDLIEAIPHALSLCR